MAGPLWWSLGVEESSLLHECIKGIKDGRGGRGSSEPRSVKGLSPEVHRPAGVDKEEERPGLTEGGGDQFTQPPQHTHPWTSPLFFGRIHSPTSHRSGMAMLLIESPLSPCMVVPEEHPPPRPARFFPFSRFPTLGGGAGQASEKGWPWSARHWTGRAGLEQQEEQRWPWSQPPPQGRSHHIRPQPPLCQAPSGGVFMGRGYWKQPSRGFAGLKHLGLVAHCLRGQGCSSSQYLLLSYRWRGEGS